MSSIKQWRSLTQNLRKVLDELPSPSEREESIRSINELVSVLGDLSNALGAMPTSEEASRAKESLARLESIINTNPLLRGGSSTKTTKPQVRNGAIPYHADSPVPKEVIEQNIADLSAMPEIAMRSELEDSRRYPNGFLRVMLAHLGRRAPSRGVKSEMIDEIVVTLVNRRTLEGISGRPRL